MKLLLIPLLVASALAFAEDVTTGNTAFGYLTRYGVPRLEALKAAEEAYNNSLGESRIVGGGASSLGQFPYQAALLIDLIGVNGQAVCGAVLVSDQHLVTAAHCWFDGLHQAWRFTVILGTVHLFSGGTRLQTSVVVAHPEWLPQLIRNDIAVIYLPARISASATIAPIALPSGNQLHDDFAGQIATASGFGLTSTDGSITTSQYLSHVELNVITNSICSLSFPLIVQPSNICTSSVGGIGTCGGDSGGPLAVQSEGRPLLVGITSFGSAFACELELFPSVFARVTEYMDFIEEHMRRIV